MARLAFALAMLLPLMAVPASAQQAWQVLERLRVFGKWAQNCGAAPSGDNPHVTYSKEPTGRVALRTEYGPGYVADVQAIDSAQTTASGHLMERIRDLHRQPPDSFDVVSEVGQDRLRALSSTRVQDGKRFIVDGKLVASGEPIAALSRCR